MQVELIQKSDLEQLKSELLFNFESLLKKTIKEKQEKQWITENEACKLLDVSKSTIQNYRKKGVIPFSQYGSKIKYKSTDLQAFLEKNYIKNYLNNSKHEC
ncbi:MAG: helix-turn-helix domain-containing protein [Saprospiraceae bacterium]|nr:helix-turn-helix domain-containing protein [Saprospiraceae bacterium]